MPQVTCGPENITIEGSTEELFEGVIFIKNWRRTNGCAAVYSVNENTTTPSLSIPLNRIAQCGLVLRRNVSVLQHFKFTVISVIITDIVTTL
uniref:ZP domain-containing protein n=1 Tax=Setaria digitata TaxID=48799 RepID=A0A915PKK9_9BILA